MPLRFLNAVLCLIAIVGVAKLVNTRIASTELKERVATAEQTFGSIDINSSTYCAKQIESGVPNIFVWRCFTPPGRKGYLAIQIPEFDESGLVSTTFPKGLPWQNPDQKYSAISPGDRFIAACVIYSGKQVGTLTVTENDSFFRVQSFAPKRVEFLQRHFASLKKNVGNRKLFTAKSIDDPLQLLSIEIPKSLRDEFEDAYFADVSTVEDRNWRFGRVAFGSKSAIDRLKAVDSSAEWRRIPNE